MYNIAPFTRLLATLAISIWIFLIKEPEILAIMATGLVLLLTAVTGLRKSAALTGGLLVIAISLAAMQYWFGMTVMAASAVALRMFIMIIAFIVLFTSTRSQDLTTALVVQCHAPYEYAFLFTASLRFIPDLLAEIRIIQEAQACRGYRPHGNPLRRLILYLAVVQPLVLRSVSRSDNIAMSLELRGFNAANRSFLTNVALKPCDYLLIALMIGLTLYLLGLQFNLV